jgi:hypothetical protein
MPEKKKKKKQLQFPTFLHFLFENVAWEKIQFGFKIRVNKLASKLANI